MTNEEMKNLELNDAALEHASGGSGLSSPSEMKCPQCANAYAMDVHPVCPHCGHPTPDRNTLPTEQVQPLFRKPVPRA